MAEAQAETEFTEAELTGEGTAEAGGKEAPTVETPVKTEPEPTPAPLLPAPITPEVIPEPVKEPPKTDRVVPLAALHEERARRQELQKRIDAFERDRDAAIVKKDPATMILEDPEEFARMQTQTIEDLRGEIARDRMEQQIKTAVPDFFDQAPKMEELLLGEGMTEDAIRNIIGASGVEAPALFKVFSKLTKASDPVAMEAQITARLTPKITEDVTRALMAKFNIVNTGVNIGKLPGAPPDGKIQVESEQDLAKLTPEAEERWLSGG